MVKRLHSVRKNLTGLTMCINNDWKFSKINVLFISRISVGQTGRASDHVKQHVMVLPDFQAKKEWLQQMLPVLVNVGLTLVFVATRIDCESVADVLRQPALSSNISIATLHGDKHTSDRQKVLKGFMKGQVNVLVATDVAARGIDINVATVVCFDPAKNLDTHVHRIGRAGRLAKNDQEYREGNAYTLLTAKDADFAQVLLNAFERDRREINPDLRELAQKSRKSGNITDTRERWNKAGLGFSSEQYYGPASSAAAAEETRQLNEYSDVLPTAKKSRWN
jgi:ATP-dependent RNA helicase DDX42